MKKKLEDYQKSRYQSVVNFSDRYSGTSNWGSEEIIQRTKYVAKCMYERKLIAQPEDTAVTQSNSDIEG